MALQVAEEIVSALVFTSGAKVSWRWRANVNSSRLTAVKLEGMITPSKASESSHVKGVKLA